MQCRVDSSRYEEAEEIAEIIDMVPSVAVTCALNSANKAGWVAVSMMC
jgi:hypothetical protein